MASPTAAETRLLEETEDHIASLLELLRAYEVALHNARTRDLIDWLAIRVEGTAERVQAARGRREQLRRELQRPVG